MSATVQGLPSPRLIVVGLSFLISLMASVGAYGFYGALHEPPDGKVYHGAQAEVRPESIRRHAVDWKGLKSYARACGHSPKLVMHYITFDPRGLELLASDIKKIVRQPYNYIPQIGLDFYVYPEGATMLEPLDITERIAAGEFDAQIRFLAKTFVSMKTAVFLRPGYEFGGNGQGQHASKQFWVGAWRRIHDLFREEKADKVAFVWNTLDAVDCIDYYPGDDYVDWWGINIFTNDADQDVFINAFIREAAKHQKPVMIAESTPRYLGSIGGQLSWEKWYKPYFNLISKYDNIKAFCYINASWKHYPDISFLYDCRIQSNALIASRYREVLSGAEFIHAEKK